MKEIIAEEGRIKYIGYQGENRRYKVRFHLADVLEEYPDCSVKLTVRRPYDPDGVTAAQTELDGTDLVWTVTSRFLQYAGTIRAQVVCTDANDVIAKDETYRFKVLRAVAGGYNGTPAEISMHIDDNGDLIYSVTGFVDVDFMLDAEGDLLTTAMSGYALDGVGDLIQEDIYLQF